jgi:hypothetical protein
MNVALKILDIPDEPFRPALAYVKDMISVIKTLADAPSLQTVNEITTKRTIFTGRSLNEVAKMIAAPGFAKNQCKLSYCCNGGFCNWSHHIESEDIESVRMLNVAVISWMRDIVMRDTEVQILQPQYPMQPQYLHFHPMQQFSMHQMQFLPQYQNQVSPGSPVQFGAGWPVHFSVPSAASSEYGAE